MAPCIEIEPGRSTDSNSESDYDIIRDDESIEVINEVDDESWNNSRTSGSGLFDSFGTFSGTASNSDEIFRHGTIKFGDIVDVTNVRSSGSSVGVDVNDTVSVQFDKSTAEEIVPYETTSSVETGYISEEPSAAICTELKRPEKTVKDDSNVDVSGEQVNASSEECCKQSDIDKPGSDEIVDESDVSKHTYANSQSERDNDQLNMQAQLNNAEAQVAKVDHEMVSDGKFNIVGECNTEMNGSVQSCKQCEIDPSDNLDQTIINDRDILQTPINAQIDQNQDMSSEDACIEMTTKHLEEKQPSLKIVGKFRCADEQIKIKTPSPMRVDQLGYSARLKYGNILIKFYNEGSLMSADDNFLAKIELVTPLLLEETMNFGQAKEVFLQQLRIVKVLQDDLTNGRFNRQSALLAAVEKSLAMSTVEQQFAMNCIELSNILKDSRKELTYETLCHKIMQSSSLSEDLKQSAAIFNELEDRTLARNRLLTRFGFPQTESSDKNLVETIKQLLVSSFANYNNMLLEKAPKYLHDALKSLNQQQILLIRGNDIKLFTDLFATLNDDVFQKPLTDLADRWIANIKSINYQKSKQIFAQTNPIYFFLCKSLDELIVEISSRTDHLAKELLISNSSGWHPIKKISWKSESSLTKCLEREYYFIFKLLKHFELGSCANKKHFEYKVKLFNEPTQESMWKRFVTGTRKFFGNYEKPENFLDIADEFYVWYCLLDDALTHVLPGECQIDSFETIIQSYIDFLCEVSHDQLETLRVITHNTARFIVQTMPYITLEDSSLIDKQILQKQLDLINSNATRQILSSNNFRDLVDVFNVYWKNREDIIAAIPSKINLPEMASVKDRLLEIVLVAIEKNVASEEMVAFFRAYSDLLVDLNDVQFDWFVKKIDKQIKSFVDLALVEPVENKWINTENVSYRVINQEKFLKLVSILLDNVATPKHYVIEVVSTLLSYIQHQLNKTQWKSGETLSPTVQICTTNELIFAVRNSFLYLLEQPDYISFEQFYDERIKPFASAMDHSRSHRDFTNRIYLIKESFWYIRKQNEMDFEGALELFRGLNNEAEDQLLRKAYHQYNQSFQQFMQESGEDLSSKASKIAKKVLVLASKSPFKSWTETYKQEKLPEMLAGLAALWSVLVSKDVSSTGKYLTPHCIQILCILRLLSVDREGKGVAKHLAQVLTGQGKSLVLGLTAALFALTGHKPQIVCYNQYLVTRDESDFMPFFAILNINNDITYSTYDGMANALIAPVIDGRQMKLRDLITDMLLKNTVPGQSKFTLENRVNSVLLIDEVDVFFTKHFYGSVYCPLNRMMLQGLELIQQKIWSLTEYPLLTSEPIKQSIYEYIKSSDMAGQKDFQSFIARMKSYDLLIYVDGMVKTKRYTNRSLFDEHLCEMIKCAIEVKTASADQWSNYKLSNHGTILSRYREQFVNFHINSYYMVFNYFRLRGSDFSVKVGMDINYGYLTLDCGSISYAMLPKSYPLILGVSGTVTSLNQHEKDAIKDVYNIRELSTMPSFFGCSNLQFNPLADFQQLASKSEWLNAIFCRANAVLGAKRSVLVFFESDLQLNQFHAEYSGQFDRLNVLTEDTDAKQKVLFIDEAGVAKTITLATRGMGRGADYKSSVSIEKHGGLHVIQTFFSLDVKEEVQIKGRTARKDNRGSYELIVCQSDLERAGFLRKVCEVNYQTLDAARLALALKENEQILGDIVKGKNDHEVTMRYMQTFFTNH
ncbi:uncharacterized protein LOC131677338 [Topomyia yanbarensis]|uniref:uncharacterized protein LOC131677338 n=1 Tax=Topomyia yanbarensis TaxID=2498891 RepID=UPI00273BA51C|nr:uncharacterized protein LOC131677338 [Topomyia yanbarensis]